MINEGDPVCASVGQAAAAIYTHGRTGCGPLGANLRREQYQTPPVTQRKAPFAAQMGTYGQYFEWQNDERTIRILDAFQRAGRHMEEADRPALRGAGTKRTDFAPKNITE